MGPKELGRLERTCRFFGRQTRVADRRSSLAPVASTVVEHAAKLATEAHRLRHRYGPSLIPRYGWVGIGLGVGVEGAGQQIHCRAKCLASNLLSRQPLPALQRLARESWKALLWALQRLAAHGACLAAGYDHTLLVRCGVVYSWGQPHAIGHALHAAVGQEDAVTAGGHGPRRDRPGQQTPRPIFALAGRTMAAAAAGDASSLLLTADGALYTIGSPGGAHTGVVPPAKAQHGGAGSVPNRVVVVPCVMACLRPDSTGPVQAP